MNLTTVRSRARLAGGTHSATSAAPAARTDRSRHERRLGLLLAAPSFVVMVAVTAYPLLYAVVLSLYRYRLTDPAGKEFIGLENYVTVLRDPIWWADVATTAFTWLWRRRSSTSMRAPASS